MKSDLTYEQCERLKSWGLDQTLEKGDWIFIEDGGKWVGYLISIEDQALVSSVLTRSAGKYVKLPSAEEMIEFCQAEAQKRWSRATIGMRCFIDTDGTVSWPMGILDLKGERIIGPVREREFIESLYALCEKVFGGKENK